MIISIFLKYRVYLQKVIILLCKCHSWVCLVWTSVLMHQNEVLIILGCCVVGNADISVCCFNSGLIKGMNSHLLRILSIKSMLVSRTRPKFPLKHAYFSLIIQCCLQLFKDLSFVVKWKMRSAFLSLERLVSIEYSHTSGRMHLVRS